MAVSDNFCIFVVEDQADDVYFLKRALRQAGVSRPIMVAEDGEEALAYLAGYPDSSAPPPALMLLDLEIPGLSGFEVLSDARKNPGLSHLPIIVFSNSENVSDIQRALKLGATDYRVKPSKAEDFIPLAKDIAEPLPCGASASDPIAAAIPDAIPAAL